MVIGSTGVGVGVGAVGAVGSVGAGMSPGLPAFVAQRAASVVVLPRGNIETEESRACG